MNKTFEDFVVNVNWCSANCNSEDIKLSLMRRLDHNELKKIEDYALGLRDKLYAVMDEHVLEFPDAFDGIWSDDGLNDCLSHIVSLGEYAVDEVLANPGAIAERYAAGDFEENFFYIFPSLHDYDLLTLPYYEKAADCIMSSLEKYRDRIEDPMDVEDIRDICEDFRQGKFNPEFSYAVLQDLGSQIGQHSYIANVWSDGRKFFYGMTK